MHSVATGSIAIYISMETFLHIFAKFKRHNSLYFWSLIVANLGTIFFTVGFFSLFFTVYTSILEPLVVLTIGWWSMVTGFSVIMYSRLAIINVPKNVIRAIMCMIIFNFLFSHLPTTLLTFGANLNSNSYDWVYGYSIEEKVQMTLFWVQETILSLVYLKYTNDAAKLLDKSSSKKLLSHTVYINILVLVLDLIALVFEYCNLYDYQIMFKAVLYAIKIKCEFAVLQILIKVLVPRGDSGGGAVGEKPNGTKSITGHSTISMA
ncbi:hypothetical protein HK101_008091 [Irineochytrium annulatum]|nr:hypothetical protein HK101_008091 [Irineochytrium annulatum]